MNNYKKPFMARQRDELRQKNKAAKKFKLRVVRKTLVALVGTQVQLSAIVPHKYIYSTNKTKKPILLTDCVVDSNINIDHLWVSIDDGTRTQLLSLQNNSRVLVTCVPYLYTSRHEHESAKVGVSNITLVSR